VLTPVPAPAGLLGDAVVSLPDATWRKTQVAIGGIVMLAPPTFGGLLGAFAHVPALAGVVDGASPAYTVLGDHERWVVAVHVITAARARSTLLEASEGTGPPFRVESHADGIDVLKGTGPTWLGLAGTWVLVGSDREAIVALGPYAYRTLPTRAPPSAAIGFTATGAALAGPIRAELVRRAGDFKQFLIDKDDEQRRAHGGRAPDLADPKPIIAIADGLATRAIDVVTAMQAVELTLDVQEDAIDAHVTMTPPPSAESTARAWVDGLVGGAPTPLEAASADAIATLFWHSTAVEHEASAKAVSDLLADALGTRVPAADVRQLADLLARAARARGDWAMASVTAGALPGLVVRVAATDAPKLTSSIEEAVDVVRKPAWVKWEADALSVTKVDRTGPLATLDADGTRVQATWAARASEVDFAAGLNATAMLAAGGYPRTLATDPKTSPWLRAIGADVVWAIAARPLMLNSPLRLDPACVALTASHHTAEGRARVSGIIVRQLVTGQWSK